MLILAILALVLWLALLIAPWQVWRCRERLEPEPKASPLNPDFSVLIPARNEASVIADTLAALTKSAPGVPVVLVNDQSEDA
ncbi:MAG: glycosyl transferase, partial [Gammaproteobacteria bacterium]|nr:glycosyl transferase [Gammaproteobacteria bacterium]